MRRFRVLIDCESCAMQHTPHCRECIVTALVERRPDDGAVVLDASEERAVRELARAGLVPEIRMRRSRPVEGMPRSRPVEGMPRSRRHPA